MPRQRKNLPRARRVFFEVLEPRQLLAKVWRNPVDAIDVNNDGQVGAFDALDIINELNTVGTYDLPAIKPAGEPFLDPTGDNVLTAFDALAVINHLNSRQAGAYVLQEQAGRIADQQSITISAGALPAGARTYRLLVLPQFDVTDTQSATEDLFAVYLFNPVTGQTVIDAGTAGSSLFTLRGAQPTVHNGLVQWDGSHLSIDLSQIAAETLELRLQLLNPDADSGSKVTIIPVSNLIDPLGVPRSPGTLRSPPTLPAAAVTNLASFISMPTLSIELENPIYNQATGRFTAEVRLANNTAAPLTNGIVRLPGVSAANVVNASGVIGTVPYWNFASVIGAAGVAPGAKSGWLKIELSLNGQSFLWRPDARGYTSTEQLAQLGVFSTNFAEPQERQVFHMPLTKGEGLLGLRFRGNSNTVRLLEPDNVEVPLYSFSYYEHFGTYFPTVSGDHQFEVTSNSTGDYAILFQNVANLTELTIGSELSGYLDPRLGPQVYRFFGQAGQRLVFENRLPFDASQVMNWQVINTADELDAQFVMQGQGGDYVCELGDEGWYYLILRPPFNDGQFRPYDFVLRSPVQTEQPLTFGIAQSATFQTFGEDRIYSFTGQPGDRIAFDILQTSSPNVELEFINPNRIRFPFDTSAPFLLDEPGTWKLVLKGDRQDNFTFRLQNAADLNVFAADMTMTGDVIGGVRSEFFRVPLVAGEVLTFVNNNASSAQLRMYDSAGQLLSPVSNGVFQARETGDALLQIHTPFINSTAPFNFTLQKSLEAPVVTAGLDVDYTGTLTPGTTSIGTFSASAGMQLMFDKFAAANDTSGFSVRVTGPDFNQIFNKDSDIITLVRSGTYTLSAINAGATAVPYGFRIIDLAGVPFANHGDVIGGTLTAGKTTVRKVAGVAGEQLLLSSLNTNYQGDLTFQLKTGEGSFNSFYYGQQLNRYGFRVTQTHFLTIEQNSLTDRPLSIHAALTSSAPVLPIGADFSGTLGPNGGVMVYRFHAQKGQVLHLDTESLVSNGWVNALVFDREQLLLNLDTPNIWKIYRDDDYFLWLHTDQTAAVSYALNASYLPTSTPIAFDTVISGTLEAGKTRTYHVDLEANAFLAIDGLNEGTLSAHISIFSANAEPSSHRTNENWVFNAYYPGRYTIVVSDSTAPYSFRILNAREAPLLPLSTNVLGSIPADGQTRIWRISPPVGRLYIDSNASAAMPFLSPLALYSPYGYLQASTTATVNNDLNTATSFTGDYYLITNAASVPFNYELRVRTSETTVIPITLGSTVSGVLQDPTDTVEYVFQGTRGQHIHLEGLTNAAFRLVHPNGFVQPTTEGFTMLLPTTGEYRVRVFSFNNQINMDYRFQIADVATLPLVPLNTPISGSTTQGEWFMYRLPAAVGNRIAFDSQYYSGPTLNQSWRLISPEATFAFIPVSPFIDGDRTVTLIDDGNYVLVVRLPAGADYAFQVNTLTNPIVTVAGLNQTYSGTVVNTDVVNVPFTGTAGQRVLLDVLDNATLPPARLLGPDGSVVVLNNNDAGATSDRLFVLPVSGTYQLEISAAGSPTPRNYRFRLLNVSALPLTPLNTPFAVNLSLPYEGNVWAFEATAGDQLAIELGLAQISAGFRVIQPDGRQSLTQSIGQLPKIMEISQTGRHYLVMDGQGVTPFSEIGHIWNIHNLPLITSEDPITVHFTNRDWHFYSFDLTAGDRVYFTPTTTPPTLLEFSLTGPRGLTETVSLDKTTNPNGFTVAQSGRYTLILQHNSTTAIDFTFQIHVLPLREFFGAARE